VQRDNRGKINFLYIDAGSLFVSFVPAKTEDSVSQLTLNHKLENFDLLRILKYLPGIIIGLTVHEFSHAYIANRCGDSTAKDQGRVTLNPFKHIDLMGFAMLIVVGFGWAKPVQFNEQNLRNPRTDVMKIAIAGPLSNAILNHRSDCI